MYIHRVDPPVSRLIAEMCQMIDSGVSGSPLRFQSQTAESSPCPPPPWSLPGPHWALHSHQAPNLPAPARPSFAHSGAERAPRTITPSVRYERCILCAWTNPTWLKWLL